MLDLSKQVSIHLSFDPERRIGRTTPAAAERYCTDGRATRKSARCIVLDVEHPAYVAARHANLYAIPALPDPVIHWPWQECWRTAEAAVLQPYQPFQRGV